MSCHGHARMSEKFSNKNRVYSTSAHMLGAGVSHNVRPVDLRIKTGLKNNRLKLSPYRRRINRKKPAALTHKLLQDGSSTLADKYISPLVAFTDDSRFVIKKIVQYAAVNLDGMGRVFA